MYAKGGLELERVLRARAMGSRRRRATSTCCWRAGRLARGRRRDLALKRMAGGDLEVAAPVSPHVPPGETEELRLYTPRGGQVREEGSADSSIGVRVVPADPRAPEPDRPRYEPFRDWGQDLLFFPSSPTTRTRVVLGARALLTRFGFGLDPFSSQMNFAAAWATGVNRPRLEYAAQLRTRSPITGLLYLAYSASSGELLRSGQPDGERPARGSGFYNVNQEQLIVYPILETSLLGPLAAMSELC